MDPPFSHLLRTSGMCAKFTHTAVSLSLNQNAWGSKKITRTQTFGEANMLGNEHIIILGEGVFFTESKLKQDTPQSNCKYCWKE